MAVVKLSKSKKAVMFVVGDEDASPGSIFSCSAVLLKKVIDGDIRGDMVVLSKMAIGTDGSRFKVSPVWGDTHTSEKKNDGVDGFGKKFDKERVERRANNTGHTPW